MLSGYPESSLGQRGDAMEERDCTGRIHNMVSEWLHVDARQSKMGLLAG